MNEATLQYVRQHADEDVRQLALRGSKDPEVDMTAALQQIAGRQTARKKLPSWAALDDILYPPHLNLEQCSSEPTARYKYEVCQRLLKGYSETTSLTDLTGGFGVDFTCMSEAFDEATYVEQNSELCAIASNNLCVMNRKAHVVNADGTEHLHTIHHVTMIFMDPARRNEHGARTYGISDCTPDVIALRDELLQKADFVMLKLSPMLDWRKTVNDLGEQWVNEIHIVSTGGECKELLIVLSKEKSPTPLRLICVNDNTLFQTEHINDNTLFQTEYINTKSLPQSGEVGGGFLYEPNASIMKAGCFAELCRVFPVKQLAQNSHLFVSDRLIADFPGRQFRILAVSSMNKKELKEKVMPLKQANITVRNFPLSVAELRKRLKMNDGGSNYIFATTLSDGSHVLMICCPPKEE